MITLDFCILRELDNIFEGNFEYSVEHQDCDGTVCFLSVTREGVTQEYMLVKLLDRLKIEPKQNTKHCGMIQPVFVFENKDTEIYGAFEKKCFENFTLAKHNNIGHIETLLKTLAEFQAEDLARNEDSEALSEYNMKPIIDAVISFDYFKDFDQSRIFKILGEVQDEFNKLLKSGLLVKSVWSSSCENSYVSKDGCKILFLDISSHKLLPPAFDALLYIFQLSDEKFRQKHFVSLISLYFKSLMEALQKLNSKIAKKINRLYTELQIRTLLPVVKLQIARSAETISSLHIEEVLTNISNFLRYPLIHQEDIYEITKNKLSSDDYDLLSFELEPLNEKNGHLGEYFYLNITVKSQNKKQNLKLFAKFLIAETEVLKEMLQSGVGKTEDFFYTKLYPLFTENGLESLLDFAPRCYLSRLGLFLVLDDLGSMGYTGLRPNSTLNYDALRIILGKLAKFHSCTFIVEEILSKQSSKEVRLGDEYGEYFEEKTIKYDGTLRTWYDKALDSLYYVVNKFPELTKNTNFSPEVLKQKLKSTLFSVFLKIKRSEKLRNVINHGDMYVSNVLFKFGKDRTVEDGMLVDFQILRYIPPAYEVMFFIFLTSTKEIRDKLLKTLLDEYYEDVTNNLKTFNLNPEKVFPKQLFEEDVKYAKSASIAMAFMYAHILHIDPDFREEILHDQEKSKYYMEDNKDEFMDISWKIEHYRNMLKGLAEDVVHIMEKEF